MSYAIEVNDIWKKYRIHHDRTMTLKERLLFSNRNHYEDLWVLKGIDLAIEKGETIGLIGQNGSGKSTLLKLLTRIIFPDRGSIKIRGKVSSLLELGAGFHPDFSGLENIYMNAALFGMTRKDIEGKMDEIIDFSELGSFIDSPVRTYSSGMYMRLAFSVAVNVDPEVLLIDEILAVGDQNYQIKCFNKMMELKGRETTIVIVSHDMESIERMCSKTIWLDQGVIKAVGFSPDVRDQYNQHNYLQRQINNQLGSLSGIPLSAGSSSVSLPKKIGNNIVLEYVALEKSATHQVVNSFESGEDVDIFFRCSFEQVIQKPEFGIGIFSIDGTRCYGTNTQLEQFETKMIKAAVSVRFSMPALCLVPGQYRIDIGIVALESSIEKVFRSVLQFEVVSPIQDLGVFRPEHSWTIVYD